MSPIIAIPSSLKSTIVHGMYLKLAKFSPVVIKMLTGATGVVEAMGAIAARGAAKGPTKIAGVREGPTMSLSIAYYLFIC